MKLTNTMIKTLQEKVKTGLEKEIIKPVATSIICVENRIAIIVSSLETQITDVSYINKYTNLTWEKEGDKIFFKSGYVVFYDECDGMTFEQYNEIDQDGDFHSPILYVDGKQSCSDWEPNIDWFEFERELPKCGSKAIERR